tara:strand:+ start:5226 stop:6104 length:879 start_codon:yes stop_codon:yes gene_type:complete
MNLHALRVFHTVAKLSSFSAAAEALYISQPAISKALKELEYQLNIQLIERASKGKKLALSEGGQALFEHACSIFAIEKAAIEDIKSRTGLKRGTLVIGASTTIASYWLPPYLAKFCAQYPEIKLEVQIANTAQIEYSLLECTIDLALVEGTPTHPHIISKHWQKDLMSVVIPSNLKPAKNLKAWLNKQFWLLREPGSGTLEMSVRLLQQNGLTAKNSMQLGSNEAIAQAVTQGMGVALLPDVITEDLVILGKMRRLSQPNNAEISRPLYQLHYKGRPSSHIAQAFEKSLFIN